MILINQSLQIWLLSSIVNQWWIRHIIIFWSLLMSTYIYWIFGGILSLMGFFQNIHSFHFMKDSHLFNTHDRILNNTYFVLNISVYIKVNLELNWRAIPKKVWYIYFIISFIIFSSIDIQSPYPYWVRAFTVWRISEFFSFWYNSNCLWKVIWQI